MTEIPPPKTAVVIEDGVHIVEVKGDLGSLVPRGVTSLLLVDIIQLMGSNPSKVLLDLTLATMNEPKSGARALRESQRYAMKGKAIVVVTVSSGEVIGALREQGIIRPFIATTNRDDALAILRRL